MKNNKLLIVASLALILVLALLSVFYPRIHEMLIDSKIATYEDCIKRYEVSKVYPPSCTTASNKMFVNENAQKVLRQLFPQAVSDAYPEDTLKIPSSEWDTKT